MAHFAQISNNIVRQVIVVSNDDCAGGDFPESEAQAKHLLHHSALKANGYKRHTTPIFEANTQASETPTTQHLMNSFIQ